MIEENLIFAIVHKNEEKRCGKSRCSRAGRSPDYRSEFGAGESSEFRQLEVHLLNYAAIVIPGEMTAMELIQAGKALNGMAVRLLSVVAKSCPRCDSCGMNEPCELITDEIYPKVIIPAEDLLAAGIELESKLVQRIRG